MTAPVLSCRGVVHDYDGAPALRGVDLDVLEGEVVAVTGPSGSGKSTLLLCLAGIVVPTEGSVILGGVDLGALGERGRTELRRKSVGVVFQYGTLVPELTGEENVALPLLLSGRPRRESLAAGREWLERLGVGTVCRTTAGRMSGGERQRVALARALVTRPRVVLADEPTGALDSVASDMVVTELVGATRDAGAAVVLVTHDERVAAHADREVHLWDGRVDRFAAHEPPPEAAEEGVFR
jgi:putative ABC transport system ATP-binding protein